ncbi:kelch repeat protein [Thermoascus aurantiacus ATCC 26904]
MERTRMLLPYIVLSIVQIVGASSTFCARIFHSSLIVNHTLFIDGGEFRFIEGNHAISAFIAQNMQTVDLSKPFSNSDDDLFGTLVKPQNDSEPNLSVPTLNEGVMSSDGSSIFLYGGEMSTLPGKNPIPSLATWKYDIQLQSWTSISFNGVPDARLTEGLTAQSSTGQGYYLGGIVSPLGDPMYSRDPHAISYLVSGTLALNTEHVQLPQCLHDWAEHVRDGGRGLHDHHRVGREKRNTGGLRWIYEVNRSGSEDPGDRPGRGKTTVSTYDIANDTCHSIYVFGGEGVSISDSDGSVYVLSLPSFRWIRLTQGLTPRIKSKCHLLGKHTMLVVGGVGRFANGLALFDPLNHTWMTRYDPADDEEYRLNSQITDVIGGNATGGATLTEPLGGFNHTELAALFQTPTVPSSSSSATSTTKDGTTPVSSSPSSASPSSSPSHNHQISDGGLFGATVSSISGATAIILALLPWLRQRRYPHRQLPEYYEQEQQQGSGNFVPWAWSRGPLYLTPEQLSLYNGTDPSLPIYLAVLPDQNELVNFHSSSSDHQMATTTMATEIVEVERHPNLNSSNFLAGLKARRLSGVGTNAAS